MSAAPSDTLQSDTIANDTFVNRRSRDEQVAMEKLEAQIRLIDGRVDQALQVDEGRAEKERAEFASGAKPPRVKVWGIPFAKLTLASTLTQIDEMIRSKLPGYFITANLNYNMLTERHAELEQVNDDASFIVCDGMPMVAWSRRMGDPLPERVAGSELIYAIAKWASVKGYRVYFLGGAPGVAQKAAAKLEARYPGFQTAGVESPPFRPLSDEETTEMVDRIRASNADILFVAFGQPKGEKWIHEHYKELGIPVAVQIGASFDFVAGGMLRAPLWIQKIGMEWFYRMAQEPRRLFSRYWGNSMFLLRTVARESFSAAKKESP